MCCDTSLERAHAQLVHGLMETLFAALPFTPFSPVTIEELVENAGLQDRHWGEFRRPPYCQNRRRFIVVGGLVAVEVHDSTKVTYLARMTASGHSLCSLHREEGKGLRQHLLQFVLDYEPPVRGELMFPEGTFVVVVNHDVGLQSIFTSRSHPLTVSDIKSRLKAAFMGFEDAGSFVLVSDVEFRPIQGQRIFADETSVIVSQPDVFYYVAVHRLSKQQKATESPSASSK